MNDSDLKELLYAVEGIARQAGAEIMKHYDSTNIYTKNDGSKVTDADYASENIILPALKKLTPRIPVVSEERVAAGDTPDISKGNFWTLDPLDGTKEFINKTGAFVVAISLVLENKVVLGVIYHPALGILYSGMGPGTATKVTSDGVRVPINGNNLSGDLRVLVNEPCTDMEPVKGYLTKQFGSASGIDTQSGILRACQVAEGKADMAVVHAKKRQGRTPCWDVAPGHAIVEAAGGKVETLDGQPLRYDAPDLQVPPHIVFSPPRAPAPEDKNKPSL